MNTQVSSDRLKQVLGVCFLMLAFAVCAVPRIIGQAPHVAEKLSVALDENAAARATVISDSFLSEKVPTCKEYIHVRARINRLGTDLLEVHSKLDREKDRLSRIISGWRTTGTLEQRIFVDQLVKQSLTIATDVQIAMEEREGTTTQFDLGKLGRFLLVLFTLSLPLVIGGYLLALIKFHAPMRIELQYGFVGFWGTVMLGPFGLLVLPGPDHRRHVLWGWAQYQTALRGGLLHFDYMETSRFLDSLVADNSSIEEMENALDRKFGRLREEAHGFFPQVGAFGAVAMVMFFSLLPRAHAQTPPPVEIHGFVQTSETLDKPAPALERAFVNIAAQPESHVSAFVQGNLAAQKLLDAQVKVETKPTENTVVALRAGNLFGAFAQLTPPPYKEVLIGGPEVERVAQFFSPGVEGMGRWNSITTRFGITGGDTRPGVQGSLVWNGDGFRLGAALHDFADLKGRHTRGISELYIGSPRIFTNAHIAAEWLGSNFTWIASALLGVRPNDGFQVAAGFDEVQNTSAAAAEHIARAQVTALPLGGKLYIGLMQRWSSLTGWSTTLRLQGAF